MQTYTVKRGDTLWDIAQANHTTINTLVRLNHLSDPHYLQIGKKLTLPGDTLELSSKAPAAQAPAKSLTPVKLNGQDLNKAPATPDPADRRYLSTDRPRAAKEADVQQLAKDLDHNLSPKSPFLKQMAPAAQAIQNKYGLPANVILAQAALESNWGRAAIGKYNVFGIKGSGSQGSISVPTREYYGGRWVTIRAKFAHYGSFDEAFEAYAKTLHNGYYAKALANKSDPVRFAKALQGHYATDPQYASKLVSIMRDQSLV